MFAEHITKWKYFLKQNNESIQFLVLCSHDKYKNLWNDTQFPHQEQLL